MIDLNSEIDVLELTVRSKNVLKAEGIFTIKKLVQYTERDLIRLPNMGRKSLNEIKEHLAVNGFVLGSIFEEPEKINLNINLRDWFAGLAMQTIIEEELGDFKVDYICDGAYMMADAMMKARKK
jgi:hypothetical protein